MSLINGNKYLKSGNYDLALIEYNKIHSDSPLYPQAKFNRKDEESRFYYGKESRKTSNKIRLNHCFQL